MARKVRIEYAGACYHVINRGNYRSWIFESEGSAGERSEVLAGSMRSDGLAVACGERETGQATHSNKIGLFGDC